MVRSPVDPLADWLQERLGIQLVARTPVGGGCIHSAWCLRTAGEGRLFVKTNRADRLPLLEAEAEGLAALARVTPAVSGFIVSSLASEMRDFRNTEMQKFKNEGSGP